MIDLQKYLFAIEAEYEDGFVLSETNNLFIISSPLSDKFYNKLISKLPELEHGSMVRLSIYGRNGREDIDWKKVPKNAKPLRLKNYEVKMINEENRITAPVVTYVRFGFEFPDPKTGLKVRSLRDYK